MKTQSYKNYVEPHDTWICHQQLLEPLMRCLMLPHSHKPGLDQPQQVVDFAAKLPVSMFEAIRLGWGIEVRSEKYMPRNRVALMRDGMLVTIVEIDGLPE